MSVLQSASKADENVTSRVEEKDCTLIMSEIDCVLLSSEEEGGDLIAFVSEKLQSLCVRSLKQIVGDESLNLEETLRGSVDVTEDNRGIFQSVCPEVTRGRSIEASDIRVSPSANVDRTLREELGRPNVASTPVRAVWPIHGKRRGTRVGRTSLQVFNVRRFWQVVGCIEGHATDLSEGVLQSSTTSGGFSVLETIVRKQVDEGAMASHGGTERDGVVLTPSAEE